MNKLLIKNATLVNEGRIYASDVLIEGERIARIAPGEVLYSAEVTPSFEKSLQALSSQPLPTLSSRGVWSWP